MNDHQLASADDAERAPTVDYPARKRRIVVLMLAYSGVLGVLSAILGEGTQLDFFLGLPLLIMGVVWCFADAAERGHRIGRIMRVLLILFFLVGFVIYLFQTRGIGAIKTLGFTVMLVAAMFACTFVTALATLFVFEIAGV